MRDSTHPSPADLLLHLEEPDARIAAHLAACPACQAHVADLAAGDAHLAEWRGAHARVAPPPPPLAALQSRMRAEASWLARWRGASPSARWAPAVAAAAVAACLLLVFHPNGLWNPAEVEAAELLRHASEQVQRTRTTRSPNAPRRYHIRQGGRELRHVDEAKLRLARINLDDPLNPDDYAQWRAEQAEKQDQISRGADWARLSTTVLGRGAIESASITVGSQDWRPRARSVRFRGEEEIEMTLAQDEPAVTSAPAPGAPTVAARPPSAVEPAAVPETEIQLWEALHATGADVRDAAQLKHQDGGVCYEVWAEGEARDRVSRAMSAIPGAAECRHAAGVARERVLAPLLTDDGESPPMEALTQHFGGKERANRYLDDITRRHVGLLAEVMALDRYLRWFPPARVEALPGAPRRRVEAIALDDAAAIRGAAVDYLRLLDEGLSAAGLPPGPPPPLATTPAGCSSVTATTSLAEDLRALHRSFSELFAASAAGDVSAEEVGRARAAFARRLAGLCQQ